jgi:hypothetical protein
MGVTAHIRAYEFDVEDGVDPVAVVVWVDGDSVPLKMAYPIPMPAPPKISALRTTIEIL